MPNGLCRPKILFIVVTICVDLVCFISELLNTVNDSDIAGYSNPEGMEENGPVRTYQEKLGRIFDSADESSVSKNFINMI